MLPPAPALCLNFCERTALDRQQPPSCRPQSVPRAVRLCGNEVELAWGSKLEVRRAGGEARTHPKRSQPANAHLQRDGIRSVAVRHLNPPLRREMHSYRQTAAIHSPLTDIDSRLVGTRLIELTTPHEEPLSKNTQTDTAMPRLQAHPYFWCARGSICFVYPAIASQSASQPSEVFHRVFNKLYTPPAAELTNQLSEGRDTMQTFV